MRGVLWILLVLSLAGCKSTSTLPQSDGSQSAIQFTDQLRKSSSGAGDNTLGEALRSVNDLAGSALGKPSLKETPEYRSYQTYWCPRHAKVSDHVQVREQYRQFCTSKSGLWRDQTTCETAEGKLIFYALAQGGVCKGDGGPRVQVNVIELKGEPSQQTKVMLTVAGYRSTTEKRAEQNQADEAARMEAEARVQNADRIRRSLQRGMQICTSSTGNAGRIRTLAYVESWTPEGRVQIRIHDNLRGSGTLRAEDGYFGKRNDLVYIQDLAAGQGWQICSF